MIAMLARRLLLTAFLALAITALMERFNPTPPPLLLQSFGKD